MNNDANDKTKTKSRFLILQAQILRRRIWLFALICLYMLLYYPAGMILNLTARINSAVSYGYTAGELLEGKLYAVSSWLGFRMDFSWVIVIIGVVSAVQGYSYLFSAEKLDFYESQPVGRMERFRAVCINSLLIFEVPLAVCTAMAIFAAAVMGAMNAVTALEAVLALVRLTVIYFSSFSLGTLCVMLCGSLGACLVTAAFFLSADWMYLALFRSYRSTFFATFSAYTISSEGRFLLSPLYNSLAHSGALSLAGSMTMAKLITMLQGLASSVLVTFGVGIFCLIVSVLLYKRRRAEYTPGSIIYRPVRILIRILASAAAALLSGLLLYNTLLSAAGADLAIIICGIVLTAAVACGLLQVVYDADFRRFFAHFPEILVTCAAAVLVFFIFEMDLAGYDTFLPDADKVESASFYFYTEDYVYYSDYISGQESSVLDSMELTDIDAVLEVARVGMENLVSESAGWYGTVAYKMKNSSTVYRTLTIPYDVDETLMDAVTGSDEYSTGLYAGWGEDNLSLFAESGHLYYSDGWYSREIDAALLSGFLEAFEKDISDYCYSLAKNEECVILIDAYCYTDDEDMYAEYSVYPSYTNTLAFLAENGITADDPSAEDFEYINVSAYDADYNEYVYECTDPGEMQQILDAGLNRVGGVWKSYGDTDTEFGLDYQLIDTGYSPGMLEFKKGEVPDFVIEVFAEMGYVGGDTEYTAETAGQALLYAR